MPANGILRKLFQTVSQKRKEVLDLYKSYAGGFWHTGNFKFYSWDGAATRRGCKA